MNGLRECLMNYKFYNKGRQVIPKSEQALLDQALSQIIDTIIEELPKEIYADNENIYGRHNADGYNQCLSQLKTELNKLKGE